MPRKKKIQPITRAELVEILEFVYESHSEPGSIYNQYQEDTELSSFIDTAVIELNKRFGVG